MEDPQPTRLVWCGACESYTQDWHAHDCDDTYHRRERIAHSGLMHPVKNARKAAYKAYCREQARLRAERNAS